VGCSHGWRAPPILSPFRSLPGSKRWSLFSLLIHALGHQEVEEARADKFRAGISVALLAALLIEMISPRVSQTNTISVVFSKRSKYRCSLSVSAFSALLSSVISEAAQAQTGLPFFMGGPSSEVLQEALPSEYRKPRCRALGLSPVARGAGRAWIHARPSLRPSNVHDNPS